jgi:hypothetical protein
LGVRYPQYTLYSTWLTCPTQAEYGRLKAEADRKSAKLREEMAVLDEELTELKFTELINQTNVAAEIENEDVEDVISYLNDEGVWQAWFAQNYILTMAAKHMEAQLAEWLAAMEQ